MPATPRFTQPYTKAIGEPRKNNRFILAMSNQGIQLSAAKRPTRRQQVNTFKQAGFTRAILSVEYIQSRRHIDSYID
jgi:hypothetical protein